MKYLLIAAWGCFFFSVHTMVSYESASGLLFGAGTVLLYEAWKCRAL